MPKIRGIKPGFWSDEDVVELSRDARLLFIGLWNHACDNGHVRDKAKQIKMWVFPADDDTDVPAWLDEIEAHGFITRSAGWITIRNFAREQRPDRRFWLTCALDGCSRPDVAQKPPARRAHGVTTTSEPPTGAPDTLWEPSTNEWAHDVTTTSTLGGHVWPPDDGDGDGDSDRKAPAQLPLSASGFAAFWSAYPRKVGKVAAEKAYAKAVKLATHAEIMRGVNAYAATVRGQDQQYTAHPSTWLNAGRWADEYAPSPALAQYRPPAEADADGVPILVPHASGWGRT